MADSEFTSIIRLKQDIYIILDNENYEHVKNFKWLLAKDGSVYRKRTVYDPKIGPKNIPLVSSILAHREGFSICHLNRDKLDNRLANLYYKESKQKEPRNWGFYGDSKHPSYSSWSGMISRCYNKNRSTFKHYGGRGIKICEEWRSFRTFCKDMGDKPSSKHSIERINVDGNYEPSNCKWATHKEQMQNLRLRTDGKNYFWNEKDGYWHVLIRYKSKYYRKCLRTESEAKQSVIQIRNKLLAR